MASGALFAHPDFITDGAGVGGHRLDIVLAATGHHQLPPGLGFRSHFEPVPIEPFDLVLECWKHIACGITFVWMNRSWLIDRQNDR